MSEQELQQHIREGMASTFLAQLEQLKERIRELEADKAAYMKDLDEIAKERNYWESRATTAEQKIKEWSVRSVEQEQRISKAREILAALGSRYYMWPTLASEIQDALDALEGE